MYNHIIVGLGITGCSAAYHLTKAGATNLLLLDYGVPGVGSPSHEIVSKKQNAEEKHYYPFCSGSAVYKSVPQTNKIVTVLPPFKFDYYAVNSLGEDGLKKYVEMATYGKANQKNINIETNSKCDYRQLGSMMVCFKDEIEEFKQEYEKFKKINLNCKYLEKAELQKYHGFDAKFEAGIFFPDDAIINSTTFCQYLLVYLKTKGCKVQTNSSPMKACYMENNIAKVVLHDGTVYTAKSVLVCTGAFYLDMNLAGLLSPCYSYYKKLPCKGTVPNSPSYFTFGFTNDWTIQDNHFRVSGEDGHSGYLPPNTTRRYNNLKKFIEDNYPNFIDYNQKNQEHWQQHFGRYSKTVDHLPICGNVNDESKIYYMVGCNAWGQAILSAVSALAPGLLGYREFTEKERKFKEFVDIRRFEVKFNDKYFSSKL